MARIKYPTTIDKLSRLLIAVSAKDLALGNDSPIKLLLIQKEIVLADDATALDDAADFNVKSERLHNEAKNANEQRNKKAEPVMKIASKCAQVLKPFYSPAFRELGLWGYDITGNGKITLPTETNDQVTLMNAIKVKHESFTAGLSPLQAFITKEDLNLGTLVTTLEAARADSDTATTKTNEAELATSDRNKIVDTVTEHLRTIGGYLAGFYHESPRSVGLWGYTVDESTAKAKESKSMLKLMQQRTYSGVRIGGTVNNIGKSNVNIYKGKGVTGEAIPLLAGKSWGVLKGYSTITIENLSSTEEAVIMVPKS